MGFVLNFQGIGLVGTVKRDVGHLRFAFGSAIVPHQGQMALATG